MNESVSLFNFGFCLNYNFIVKQIINYYYHNDSPMCIASHIDTTTLADGTYELVPESESEQREAQVNLTEATEDPNSNPEEPKTATPRKASLGACPSILNLCNLLLFLSTCAFKFIGVDWNLSCMILGTYA